MYRVTELFRKTIISIYVFDAGLSGECCVWKPASHSLLTLDKYAKTKKNRENKIESFERQLVRFRYLNLRHLPTITHMRTYLARTKISLLSEETKIERKKSLEGFRIASVTEILSAFKPV